MSEASRQHRLVALMFTDVVGYSRMMGQDEVRTVRLLEHFRAVVSEAVEGHGGRVIEFAGDSVFARFESGLAAVEAGLEIQEALADYNRRQHPGEPPERQLRCRIGIHVGEVWERDGRYFGDDVNIAARLEPLARPGALCVSDVVHRQVQGRLPCTAVPMGPWHLKNIREPVRILQLWPPGRLGRLQRGALRLGYLYQRLRRAPGVAPATAVVALALVLTGFWLAIRPPEVEATYLSVAPLRNLSPESIDEYLATGVTETLISQLTTVPGLYPLPADSEGGAPFRIEGSIQQVGNHFRIAYAIVRRKDGARIGGGVMDGSLRDIFRIQDELAGRIVDDLARTLGLPRVEVASARVTTDLTAYDYYLQARQYLRRNIDLRDYEHAITLFQRALDRDPEFARAYAGLCVAHWHRYRATRNRVEAEQAETACARALSLDDSLAEVQVALGSLYAGTGRYDDAVAAFERAIELDPKAADGFRGLAYVYSLRNDLDRAEETLQRAIRLQPGFWGGYMDLGKFYTDHGRYADAAEAFRQVIRLSPDNAIAYSNLAAALLFSGHLEEAARAIERAQQIAPSDAGYSNAGSLYYYSGRYEEAARLYRKAVELSPENFQLWANLGDALARIPDRGAEADAAYARAIALGEESLRVNSRDAEVMAALARLYARGGETAHALDLAERALALRPHNVQVQLYAAMAYRSLGDRKRALQALGEVIRLGYERRLVALDPEFESLRNDPAFVALVAAPAGSGGPPAPPPRQD